MSWEPRPFLGEVSHEENQGCSIPLASGKQSQKTDGKITMLFMGKSTISTGPFSIAMLDYVSLPEGK